MKNFKLIKSGPQTNDFDEFISENLAEGELEDLKGIGRDLLMNSEKDSDLVWVNFPLGSGRHFLHDFCKNIFLQIEPVPTL